MGETDIKIELCDIDDIIVAEDQHTDMLDLLESWNLGKYFIRFRECNIELRHFRLLKVRHIDQLFKRDEDLGDKIDFEEHLEKYNLQENCPESNSVSNRSSPVQYTPVVRNETPAPSTPQIKESMPATSEPKEEIIEHVHFEMDVDAILRRSPRFDSILSYYKEKKLLKPDHRKIIVDLIIEHLIHRSKIAAKPKILEAIAKQIVEIFPSEIESAYYVFQKNRRPAGYLYSKYHNLIIKVRNDNPHVKLANKVMIETKEKSNKIDPDAMKAYENNKLWLKTNQQPMEKILEKWKLTTEYRKLFLKTTLTEIFNEWNLYQQPFGHQLIDIDFEYRFPGKASHAFAKWESYYTSMLNFYNANIKDYLSLEMIAKLKISDTVPNDAKNCIVFLLLHSVVPPTARTIVETFSTKKRKIFKPTIKDSQFSTLRLMPPSSNIEKDIKQLMEETISDYDKPVHPILFVVGDDYFTIKEFYVSFSTSLYKLPTFLQALDTCFKIFHVFEVKYPIESCLVWTLLQNFFYDIEFDNDSKVSKLLTTMNDLKQTLKIEKESAGLK